MQRVRAYGLVIAAFAVLVAACGDDSPAIFPSAVVPATSTEAQAPSSVTTAAVVTTAAPTTAPPTTTVPGTTAPPATTSPAPTVGAGAAAACASVPFDAPIPASALDVSSAAGDVDGDGVPETVTVYLDGNTWYIHVQFGFGFGIQRELEPFDPSATPWVEGVIGLGVPEELALIGTGFGLVGPVFGVWYVADCQLNEATLDGGGFEPYLGSGRFHAEAFACTADGITQYEAAQPGEDADVWTVDEFPYLWVPGSGDFQSLPQLSYATDRAGAFDVAGAIDC